MSKVKLSEIGTFKNGLNFSAERVLSGCKMIGVPDFGDNYLAKLDGLKEVDEDIVSTDYLLQDNDILFVRSNGNKNLVGRAMLIEKIKEKVTFSGFCIRFRITNNNVNPLYMLYLFKSPLFRKLFSNTQQTSISNLNQEILGNIEVELPTIGQQNRIVKVIHGITRKIENNKRINDNLSAMAYDIYMHNFFSKKPNAKLKDILTEAEKSAIQVGEAKTSNGEYPFFTSGATILKWNEPFVDGRNCFLNTGGNADVKFYVGKAAYSTDTWSISAKSEMSDYLYLMLFSIKPELDQKFFQGTGLKHLQKPLLKDRPIYVPEKRELEAFNRQVMPMFDIISENTRENQQLTSLRNWLLPMLMNGQATISD
ncbi:restriction endonuclease subunit S [Clostridium sp. AF17-2]|uniref:restriction endonuclease subunit S n=1 Tax=Clostridium sp. AF17-2 TaxID=2293000 RepID=UPI000E4F35E4|nr:restriction endonuclease subunit S [Clostridium sp. AF17-2]RHR58618.1 restriction endonuclease subunit S [Clostridium sp. AF17-2]